MQFVQPGMVSISIRAPGSYMLMGVILLALIKSFRPVYFPEVSKKIDGKN